MRCVHEKTMPEGKPPWRAGDPLWGWEGPFKWWADWFFVQLHGLMTVVFSHLLLARKFSSIFVKKTRKPRNVLLELSFARGLWQRCFDVLSLIRNTFEGYLRHAYHDVKSLQRTATQFPAHFHKIQQIPNQHLLVNYRVLIIAEY